MSTEVWHKAPPRNEVPVWIPGMLIEVKRDAVMSGGHARTTGIQSWQGGD